MSFLLLPTCLEGFLLISKLVGESTFKDASEVTQTPLDLKSIWCDSGVSLVSASGFREVKADSAVDT